MTQHDASLDDRDVLRSIGLAILNLAAAGAALIYAYACWIGWAVSETPVSPGYIAFALVTSAVGLACAVAAIWFARKKHFALSILVDIPPLAGGVIAAVLMR